MRPAAFRSILSGAFLVSAVAWGASPAAAADPGETHGIDVSHHQETVDWGAVAASGVHFVYCKATEGVDYVDPLFLENWRGARAAGLRVGPYHMFRPEDAAEDQVTNLVTTLETAGYEPGDLPPVLDIESVSTIAEVSRDELHTRVVAMLREMEERLGRRPVVYTNPSFWRGYLSDTYALAGYPLWLADYVDAPRPEELPGWKDWTFWQFTEQGRIEGVPTAVDRSRFNGSATELEVFLRGSATTEVDE